MSARRIGFTGAGADRWMRRAGGRLARPWGDLVAMELRIVADKVSARATLTDSPTARAIWAALPIEAAAQTWGDEIYFTIPVSLPEDDARDVVGLGDLGYWPPGRAFCIFFGPTPASRGSEIRPASPVNVVGRVIGDPTVFKTVRAGACVRLEQSTDESTGHHGMATAVRRSSR